MPKNENCVTIHNSMGHKERQQKRLMIMNLSEGHQIFIRAKDKYRVFSFPVIEDKAWVTENQIKSVVEIPTMYIFQHGLSVTE